MTTRRPGKRLRRIRQEDWSKSCHGEEEETEEVVLIVHVLASILIEIFKALIPTIRNESGPLRMLPLFLMTFAVVGCSGEGSYSFLNRTALSV